MSFAIDKYLKKMGLPPRKPKKDTRPKRVIGLKKMSLWEKLQRGSQPRKNTGIMPRRPKKAGFVWDPKRQDYRSTGKVLRKAKKVTYAILKRRALAAKKRDVRYSGSIFGRL